MYAHDFLHCFLAADIVEWSLAAKHLVYQNTEAPDIHTAVIRGAFDNFGAHVV